MLGHIPLDQIEINKWYLIDLHGKYVVAGPYQSLKMAEKECFKNKIDILSPKNPYDIWEGSKILITFSDL